MATKASPDIWVSLRTALLGAVLAWLTATKLGASNPELITALGTVVGYIYDIAAFKVKTWFGGGTSLYGVPAVALIAIGLATATPAKAQTDPWRAGFFYNPVKRTASQVITYRLDGDELRVGRTLVPVDLVTIGAFDASSLTGGVGVVFRVPLAKRFSFDVLPNIVLDRGRVRSPALWLGLNLRL